MTNIIVTDETIEVVVTASPVTITATGSGQAGPLGPAGPVGPLLPTFTITGAVTVGQGDIVLYNDFGFDVTVIKARAVTNSAVSTQALIFDVVVNGVTIFDVAPLLQVNVGQTTGTAVPDAGDWPQNSWLRVDVVQSAFIGKAVIQLAVA